MGRDFSLILYIIVIFYDIQNQNEIDILNPDEKSDALKMM